MLSIFGQAEPSSVVFYVVVSHHVWMLYLFHITSAPAGRWPRPQSGVKGSLSQSWTARSSGPASHDMDHKHPMQRKIGISQDATAQQQMKQRILSKTAQASPAQNTASRKSRTSQNHAKPQQTARATNGMARPAKVSILLGNLVVISKSACVHLLKRSSSFCLSLS